MAHNFGRRQQEFKVDPIATDDSNSPTIQNRTGDRDGSAEYGRKEIEIGRVNHRQRDKPTRHHARDIGKNDSQSRSTMNSYGLHIVFMTEPFLVERRIRNDGPRFSCDSILGSYHRIAIALWSSIV